MSQGELIIAADFGTSGVKLGVVGEGMSLLARRVEHYPIQLASGGVAEQRPEDWWAALARGLSALEAELPGTLSQAGALVFSAQMCGVTCVDADGVPLRPCIIWQDTRAGDIARRLVGGFPEALGYNLNRLARWIRIANGAPAKNGMDPIAKMHFLMRNEPEIWAKTHRTLDVKDWLIHRATGRFVTTADSANVTWLMDTRPGREGWSKALSKMTGMPLDKLPEIVDGSDVVGVLTPRAAAELGLPADLPVVAGGGDVTATALGSGAVADGALHLCISTSAWVSGFFPRRILSVPSSFATVASSAGNRPLLIATQESAGSALEWVARLMGYGAQPDLVAAFGDPGDWREDDPFLIPWFAGERVPVDNDTLRGVIHGLSIDHDRNAVARAAIEGVALNLRWAHEAVAKKPGVKLDGPLPLVGGGATNPVLAQCVADALNREVTTGESQFAGVLGTAALAAPAMGWDPDVWHAAARLSDRVQARYLPLPDRHEMIERRYARLRKLRKTMVKTFPGSAA
ncbi:FGGY family carbohydrate kinase [Pseudooceanicola sp.]|uniref:xylulokinase n=1 Tax=Pseudooceanicola sp. TaxID=1914328 RepID=UPI002610581F|nr:FGGY family carbohydrate kinase [Pseudooceanicola sp.]MDF1856032.1 FGGY family carbohydrate kinase [Pseudooceanicola sp.]